MKKNLFWLFALVLSVSATFTACTEDLCKDVDCGANGSCFEGSCSCNQGYEGTNCEATWSDKLVGTWKATETCKLSDGSTVTVNANVIVTKIDEFKVKVENWGAFEKSVELTGSTATDFAAVAYKDIQDRVFNITLTYGTDGKVTYNYDVTFLDGTKDVCTGGTLTK